MGMAYSITAKKSQTLWTRACAKLHSRLQTHRLGSWYRKNQIWQWKSDLTNQFLLGPDGTYEKKEGRYSNYYERTIAPVNTLFNYDVDIDRSGKKIRILSSVIIDIVPSLKSEPNPYDAFFEDHTLPRRLEKKIARLIRKGRIIYGSDATVQSGKGVFSWGAMDKCNNKNTIIKYHAPFHGYPEQSHSTRGELFGLLGCLRHTWYMSQNYYIP